MTNADLIGRVQAGDTAAWEQLYRRYLPVVWRYVYLQVGGDRHLAEDLVSETFLALVRQINQMEEGNLAGWLMAVARHKVGDHRRSAARAALLARVLEKRDPLGFSDADPGYSLENAEVRAQVIAVMDQLPEEERLLLEWKYLEGLSLHDIAGRLGRTEKAIDSELYRARRSFRLLFKTLFS